MSCYGSRSGPSHRRHRSGICRGGSRREHGGRVRADLSYTAPDPAGPSDGALTIGLLPPWVVAPDAVLSPAVAANLPSVAGSGPSCLVIDLDDAGIITGLDFALQGEIEGAVVFDAGVGGYIFADRLLVPTFITDAYPGLAVIFVTSADAGTSASVTLSVDGSTGQLTELDARAAFCGPGDLASNGDGIVGDATIPASLMDGPGTAALAGADGRNACAQVRTQGTIDTGTGEVLTTTDVTITVTAAAGVLATPPPTSTIRAPQGPAPSTPVGYLVAIAALGTVLALRAQRRHRRGSKRASR